MIEFSSNASSGPLQGDDTDGPGVCETAYVHAHISLLCFYIWWPFTTFLHTDGTL